MDTCPKCEKIILSDYKFCPRCGHSLFGDPPASCGSGDADTGQANPDERKAEFFRLAQNLSAAANIDVLLHKIGDAIEEILDAERSSIMLLDETGKHLFFKTATGEDILKKLKIPLDRGIAGWIATNRLPLTVNDPYSDERFSPETDKATGFRTTSIAGVPLIVDDQLIGVCEAINKRSGGFTREDIETLTGFAGLAAVSIANLRLHTDQKNLYANLLDFLVMGAESLGQPEPTPKGHAWEMSRLAPQLGREIGLPVARQQLLQNAALIHDIGFLGLEHPELIGINLESGLTNETKFRLHTIIGAEMIKGIQVMRELQPFIMCHHRYRNGEGFPENIPSEDITPEIEIISILEDYMTSGVKDKIDPARYSRNVLDAFNRIIH